MSASCVCDGSGSVSVHDCKHDGIADAAACVGEVSEPAALAVVVLDEFRYAVEVGAACLDALLECFRVGQGPYAVLAEAFDFAETVRETRFILTIGGDGFFRFLNPHGESAQILLCFGAASHCLVALFLRFGEGLARLVSLAPQDVFVGYGLVAARDVGVAARDDVSQRAVCVRLVSRHPKTRGG